MASKVSQGTLHDNESYGWWASGYKTPPDGTQGNIFRITKSTWNGVTDVGEVNATKQDDGQRRSSSTVAGYQHGGQSPVVDTIQKFTFASPSTATDVGNAHAAIRALGGASGTDYGYLHGGQNPPTTLHDTIERYSFDSDGNATNVGELVNESRSLGGTQN